MNALMNDKDWHEFKREYKQDAKDTRDKLSTISGSIQVIESEMTHLVKKENFIPEVDKRIHFHKRDCPGNQDEPTGNTPQSFPVAVEDRTSIVSKLPMATIMKVGYFVGAAVAGGALVWFGVK
jgi:hypothetical protein